MNSYLKVVLLLNVYLSFKIRTSSKFPNFVKLFLKSSSLFVLLQTTNNLLIGGTSVASLLGSEVLNLLFDIVIAC